jgi:hypothetical protein
MKEPSLRCQRRDGPLLEKREKWGTPVSDWSELRDEPHINRTLGEGGHPPTPLRRPEPHPRSAANRRLNGSCPPGLLYRSLRRSLISFFTR